MPNGVPTLDEDFQVEGQTPSLEQDFQLEPTPQETAARAVQIPQTITGTVNRLFQLGSLGADDFRARRAEEQRQLQQRQFVAGGGPAAGMALIPPGPPSEIVQGAERALVTGANIAARLVNPKTWLPEEEQAKFRPFGQTPEELEQERRGPFVPGRPLYVPQSPNPSDIEKRLSELSTPESILTLPLGSTRTGARVLLATMLPGVAQQVMGIAAEEGPNESKMDRIRALVVPAIVGLLAAKPEGAQVFPRRLEALRPPAEPPPVPTGPVPPREAFPPGPAPLTPVPPREAFPPGPAPTEPVPPREAFPPGPAPAYAPDLQWAFRSDLPPGAAPWRPVPPRPPEAPPAAAPVPEPTPPTAPAAPAAAKPEVARLEPHVPGKTRNKLGDPLGTTYHATPEDWAAWQDLQKLPVKEKFARSGEIEAIKNKYGGMPPQAPKEVAPAAPAAEPVGTGSPHDLVPALRTKEGRIIQGQKGNIHDDIYKAQGDIEGKMLRVDGPEHGFWNGKRFLTRDEAATYLGEKDPLHSERLIELQKPATAVDPNSMSPEQRAGAGWIEAWRQDRADAPPDTFRPNSHFGTKEQADAIAAREREAGRQPGKLHHVWIRVRNVFQTTDEGFWDKEISKAKAKDPTHDALVYENEGEGVGGKSYVPFSKEQVVTVTEPTAPAAPEPEWLGKPLSAWEPMTDPANLPKGEERARLAKSLGVPNQPGKIVQHIKRRIAEIRARPPKPPEAPPVPPADPAAPPAEAAPTSPAPEGELFNVPQEPRTGPAARAYIVRRLEDLEDVDPVTGKTFPKEDLTDAQEAARKRFRAMLTEIEAQMLEGTPAKVKPVAPATKPAAPATPTPVPATKPPVAATPPAAPAPTPAPAAPPAAKPVTPLPAEVEALRKTWQGLKDEFEAKQSQLEAMIARSKKIPFGSKEYDADRARGAAFAKEVQEAGTKASEAQNKFMDAKIDAEFAPLRGQKEPEPSPPKVTAKVLKAQKENLLSQVDQAIKDAPEEGTEKIMISVPGDGDFTVFNTKGALKRFRDHAAKEFPESVPGRGGPKVATGKGKTIPKVGDPKANDLPKIAGVFVSDDPQRFTINTSYADGTQIVATDGRQLIRIITTDAPGTLAEPVRLNSEGKVETEDVGSYPNFNQVRPSNLTLVRGGVDTAELFKLARQAQVFLKDTKKDSMELFVNKDGTLGAKADTPEVGSFEHNIKPDAYSLGPYNVNYLTGMADAARRLGNEKVDLYASDTTGPLALVGKNHEHILMGMRLGDNINIRTDPVKLLPAQTGRPVHTLPAEGFGPLTNPEAHNSRVVTPQGGKYNVIYENGAFKIEKNIPKTGVTGERWDYVADLPFDKETEYTPRVVEIHREMTKGLGREPTKEEVARIHEAMQGLLKERQEHIREGQKRLKAGPPQPPPGSAGPGSPAYGQGPDHEVLGLDLGSPAWNKIQRRYQNFFGGISQLFARRGIKQDLQSLSNAADNMPRISGLRAGDSIRVRTTEQEQNAGTFVMQALKMSGEGLSPDNAARLGELEFLGDPTGYLQTKQADMETLAQQFAHEGKKVEAQAALEASKHYRYARENFNRLKPIAQLAKRKFDRQIQREMANGIDVAYENWYVPQRHELDLIPSSDRPIVLGESRGGGPAGGFKKAKVYEDYASAIEAGFIPRTFNLADLLEHRVATGERIITGKGFFDGMREIADPVDGKPVVMDIPRRVITRPDGSLDVQETIPLGYTKQQVMGGASVAVHNGYQRLVNALTSRSQLAESAVVGTLQNIAAVEKHLMLALDTFHASRTMQAELALTGKVSLGARQRLGRALVEYGVGDLDAAVQKGEITQEMADYIRTPQQMEINGQQQAISPHALLNLGIRNGLNIARWGDALYKDWLRNMPVTGEVNKWVFDKLSRSAVAHGFLSEFERIAKSRPELNGTQVARKVAGDINVMFGNLGKQSIFRNPSLRSITQVLFLAPQWVESLARREGRAVLQLGEAVVKGRAPGTVGKGIGTGLAAYFVGTQVLNLITRGHLTFQNQERGHKLDAWIPGGQNGFFISPLSVFGEITHDILRYAQTKPDFATALTQVGANKFGPLGRFLEVVAMGRDPLSGEKIIGTGRRAVQAAIQAAPVPITISQGLRAGANLLAPGIVRPPPPGAVQRQLMASAGLKTEPVGTAQGQVYQMATDWKRQSGNAKYEAEVERRLKEDFGPSDYKDLRAALNRNDFEQAYAAYQELRQSGKTPKTIRQTLQHPHPFTGSKVAEGRFRDSLSQADRETYNKALEERRDLYHRFQQMLDSERK